MTSNRYPWKALFFSAIASIPALSHAGSLIDELSAPQQAKVKGGQQVLVTEDIAGKPWPKITVYRAIKASPEEVAAVFFDYANAKDFVPNLLKSEVAQKVSSNCYDVDYILDVPILPDEYYTIRNTIKTAGSGYRADWKLVRAVQTKDTVGSLRIEPFGDGSVICYQNLVTPGSGMAGLLRGKAIDQMKETVAAIGTQVEKQKQTNAAGLAKQVKSLQTALR